MGMARVKLPSIKQFLGERLKLKGFLTQINFKITQEGVKLATAMDRVVYAGLFLTGKALK
jgi:hypothetical protein